MAYPSPWQRPRGKGCSSRCRRVWGAWKHPVAPAPNTATVTQPLLETWCQLKIEFFASALFSLLQNMQMNRNIHRSGCTFSLHCLKGVGLLGQSPHVIALFPPNLHAKASISQRSIYFDHVRFLVLFQWSFFLIYATYVLVFSVVKKSAKRNNSFGICQSKRF